MAKHGPGEWSALALGCTSGLVANTQTARPESVTCLCHSTQTELQGWKVTMFVYLQVLGSILPLYTLLREIMYFLLHYF